MAPSGIDRLARMKLNRNVIVGIAGTSWTAVVSFLVVPQYLKFLGLSNYGLIAFFATTQALLQLLDMGLAPTMNREIARSAASGRLDDGRRLLHTLAVVYWTTAVVLGLLIAALAPVIAEHWLQDAQADPETLTHAVMLMGLVIACRWPVSLYQGALMGMQRLVVASAVTAATITLANLGAVAVLAWVSPTLEAFFLWQAAIAFVQVIIMRRAAWEIVGRGAKVNRFHIDLLRPIWRFSAGMTAIAVASVVLIQLDKIILSRMLSLADFGKYALAGMIASGLYVFLTPTFNVIYPRMAALVMRDNQAELLQFYKTGTKVLVSFLIPVAVSLALYSSDVVQVWTGNRVLASTVSPLVSLLVLGTACNGIMHFPYALQLAYGQTRLALHITVSLAVVLVPLIVLLTLRFGPIGSASAWLCLNLSYIFFGTWMTHRSIFKGEGAKWLLSDVAIPVATSCAICGVGWWMFSDVGHPTRNIATASLVGLVAIAVNALALPRDASGGVWRLKFGR